MTRHKIAHWHVADSSRLYGINDWGAGYFGLSDKGEVTVVTSQNTQPLETPLMDIVAGLEQRGHAMPVLLRIENLLDERIALLNKTFAAAINELGYQGEYRGVFPIKVNQQCHVVEEITKFGAQYHHGLEAGSKAELIIAMSHLRDSEACIVCNGYKDAEFVELGLHARKLGLKCFFVIETPSELAIILEQSQRLGVEPLIGARIKLAAEVEGHWFGDGGDHSLFGLTTNQLMDVVDQLREADMLHCLQLMHYHIGSQIPNIRNIRDGLQEACRYYVDLVQEGAPLGYLDLGGGLAVDYTGAKTNETHSKNYSIEEYCVDIVETIGEALNNSDVPHPTIITESGRATVAYSSVLLFNILDVSHFKPRPLPKQLPEQSNDFLHNLWATLQGLTEESLYKSALTMPCIIGKKSAACSARGNCRCANWHWQKISIWKFSSVPVNLLPQLKRVPPELQNLDEALADIYYGNFSLFQSLPDAWAIDQIFPVMPIHRLDEKPTNKAVIGDLTCDSDGKLDLFANADGESRTLPLHELNPG